MMSIFCFEVIDNFSPSSFSSDHINGQIFITSESNFTTFNIDMWDVSFLFCFLMTTLYCLVSHYLFELHEVELKLTSKKA